MEDGACELDPRAALLFTVKICSQLYLTDLSTTYVYVCMYVEHRGENRERAMKNEKSSEIFVCFLFNLLCVFTARPVTKHTHHACLQQ